MVKKMTRALTVVACAGAASMIAGTAHAGLTFTVDILTPDEFKFTIGGSFDADAIGDQPEWLAVKNDWTGNFGQSTPWMDDSLGFQDINTAPWTIIENTIQIGGATPPEAYVESVGNPWGDAIYFKHSSAILGGTSVSGSFHVMGTGLFDDSVSLLQLLSGFNNSAQDWARFEAGTIPAPGALALLGLAGFARRRRQR